ncbi:MAG: glycerol acyltransferase [Chitinophagaceae bacterium]|nr:MAG: glycerol acyltransferase [Chitinophagaceae bacterium]
MLHIPYFHKNWLLLLYRVLKVYVRFALRFFCRSLVINRPEQLRTGGPLLLACNHPNSFLDAILLDILFEQPLWSLARGDAFKTPFLKRLLHRLKIMPVYRTSEGVENLSENYNTFDSCIALFRQGGQVIIFSEGRCVNEWHLRPLKKGTARLAMQAWKEGIPLRVLPVGINYSSFRRYGKNIFIHFGEMMLPESFDLDLPDGVRNQAFNQVLRGELEKSVMEILPHDKARQRELLAVKIPAWQKILLAIPALAGILLHFPFYGIVRWKTKTADVSDHYDSITMALLLFFYPFYLLLLTVLSCWLMGIAGLSALLVIPFCGWASMRLKPQLDK